MYSKIRDKYFTIGTAVEPDPTYHSMLVSILINRVMKSGKKSLATRIVTKALNRIERLAQRHPVEILEQSVMKAAPQIQLKSSSARKTRRRTKIVPVEIPGFKSTKIGIKWLVDETNTRTRPGTKRVASTNEPIHNRLQRIIMTTWMGSGPCVKRKKALHRRGRTAKPWKKCTPMKKKYAKVKATAKAATGKTEKKSKREEA